MPESFCHKKLLTSSAASATAANPRMTARGKVTGEGLAPTTGVPTSGLLGGGAFASEFIIPF
jgi:hypothetical protein